MQVCRGAHFRKSPRPVKGLGRYRRSIYLLPSLLTTAAMFAGFAAIVLAIEQRFETAALAVFVAMVLDALDGRVARLTHTASEFGLHYDSLSDMLAFGVAPALVLYEWSLQFMQPLGNEWAKLGWLAAFFYMAAVALRLARFNTHAHTQDRAFFRGLPSPAGAGVLMAAMWAAHSHGYAGADLKVAVSVLVLLIAVLLVSRFSYYSFKETRPRFRVGLTTWLIILGALLLLSIHPPNVLLFVFGLYALSGPALYLFRLRRRGERRVEPKP